MASIIWTNTAQSNLIEIREYIALDSALQADLTIDAIYTKAQVLERFPEIGKKVKELAGKEYKKSCIKSTGLFTNCVTKMFSLCQYIIHQGCCKTIQLSKTIFKI